MFEIDLILLNEIFRFNMFEFNHFPKRNLFFWTCKHRQTHVLNSWLIIALDLNTEYLFMIHKRKSSNMKIYEIDIIYLKNNFDEHEKNT